MKNEYPPVRIMEYVKTPGLKALIGVSAVRRGETYTKEEAFDLIRHLPKGTYFLESQGFPATKDSFLQQQRMRNLAHKLAQGLHL